MVAGINYIPAEAKALPVKGASAMVYMTSTVVLSNS